MKVESRENENGDVIFKRFLVKKESNNFYGVYMHYNEDILSLISSGTTKDSACRKAKLLQIGFDIGRGYERMTM